MRVFEDNLGMIFVISPYLFHWMSQTYQSWLAFWGQVCCFPVLCSSCMLPGKPPSLTEALIIVCNSHTTTILDSPPCGIPKYLSETSCYYVGLCLEAFQNFTWLSLMVDFLFVSLALSSVISRLLSLMPTVEYWACFEGRVELTASILLRYTTSPFSSSNWSEKFYVFAEYR